MTNEVTKLEPTLNDGLDWEVDLPTDDGDNPRPSRTMQGDAILKFVSPTWSVSGIPQNGREFLVYGKSFSVVRWGNDQRLIYAAPLVRGEPTPNIDEMNKGVPVDEWRIAFGKPQPPYELQRCLELLDPESMERLSWPHNVAVSGSSIACDQLKRKIGIVRRLYGADLYPIVRLDQAPMTTREFGIRQRPDLPVVRWARLSERGIEYVTIGVSAQVPKQLPPMSAHPAQSASKAPAVEVPLAQEMDDVVPF